MSKKTYRDYWYDYLDINRLLTEKSEGKYYEVIDSTGTDDLQTLQRVSEAFLVLNNPNSLDVVVIPINLGTSHQGIWQGSHWVGLVIKKIGATFKVFYNDSFGAPMENSFSTLNDAQFCTLKQILINHGLTENNIIDLQTGQQLNGYDCGPWTVFNLDSLATTETLSQYVGNNEIVAQRISLSPGLEYLQEEPKKAPESMRNGAIHSNSTNNDDISYNDKTLEKFNAGMDKKNILVTDKHTYNSLLDAIDILRIKKIIEDVSKIQQNDSIIPAISNFKILNLKKVDPVYRDTSDEGVKRSECITHYSSISESIDLLSRQEGSIRNYFTNFPWDELEKVGYLLKEVINKEDISQYEVYKTFFEKDLDELKIRLEYVIKTTELRKPGLKNILDPSTIYTDKDKVLADTYTGLDFVHSEDTKPRGLENIRKVTELVLDKEKQQKILELISKAATCEPNLQEGRAALFSVTTMISEISKNISTQTKLSNHNIPFKELKEFRNKIHEFDTIIKANNLLQCVNSNAEVFIGIKEFLIGELQGKIANLVIPDINASNPTHSNNPLPPISYLPNQDPNQINTVLEIIKQALPQNIRMSQRVQDKLSICEDILSGKLPIPLRYNLQALFVKIFYAELVKEEFSKYKTKDFDAALRQNHDAIKDDNRKKLNEDTKFLNSLKAGEVYEEGIVSQVLSIIKQSLPQNVRESSQVQVKLSKCYEVLSGQSALPTNYKLQEHFVSVFSEELAQYKYKNFTTALNNNHDAIHYDRKKVSEDAKYLEALDTLVIYKENTFKITSDPSAKVMCFEHFEQSVQIPKDMVIAPDNRAQEQRDLYYINKQIELLVSSLKQINQSIDHVDNYQTVRETCSSPQFHYSHLFHLLVIGQAIQNLVGKDIFLQNATPKLLTEFEFLKWVRNGLMHNLSISEVGSVFDYFNNDLLNLQIKEHGARAYDSNEYLQHLLPEIDTTFNNITSAIPQKPIIDVFFKILLLKQLEIAYNSEEYEIEKLIIKALSEEVGSNDWYAPHSKAGQILSKSRFIDLGEIYNKQQELVRIAEKYNISVVGFFGKIVQYGFDSQQNSGIFVKCNSNEDLALFKKDLSCLVNYRLVVIVDKHLREYLNTQGILDAEEYNKFIRLVTEENSFNKTMGGMELHLAIKSNATIEDVQKLLQEECNLDLIYEGYAPVHKTCHVYTKNYQLLQLLLNYRANPNIQDKRGDTLAHYAAEENDIESLKLLQSKGADFTITNRNGYTALDYSAQHYNQNCEAYSFLLQFSQQSIGEKIVLAIKHEDLDKLKEYLSTLSDKNKILNTETDKYGLISHVACGVGNIKIIKSLVENGCNLGLISKDSATALEEACYADNVALLNSEDRANLITYLIDEVKIDITSRALHNTLYCSNLEIPKLLLDKGADPNSIQTMTPLLILINQPHIANKTMEIIKLLLQNGADILMQDEYVGNSLHLAAEIGHIQVVDLLLKYAKQTNQLDQLLQPTPEKCWVCKGMNAYEIALKYNNFEIAVMLKEYFAPNEEEIIEAQNIESYIGTLGNHIDSNVLKVIGEGSE